MNNQKIIILDFESGEVHVFPYDRFAYEDGEDFFEAINEYGYNFGDSNCQWMIVDELNIEIH